MTPRFLTGTVLKRRSFREEDRFITIFTDELGKVELLAKGSRKPTSKLAGILEPATRIRVGMVRGRSFDRLTSARALTVYPALKASLTATVTMGMLLQAVDLVTAREHPDLLMAAFLRTALHELDTGTAGPLVLGRGLFVILHAGGLKPELARCERCSRDLAADESASLNLTTGGFLCSQERPPFTTVRVSAETRAVLQQLEAGQQETNGEAVRIALPIVGRLFEALVERPLTSLRLFPLLQQG